MELYKRIDIVCANAGVGEDKEAFQDKVDEHGVPLEPRWNTFQVNLVGVCISTKLAIHFLKQHGGGKIILTTSLSGAFRVRRKWPSDLCGFQARRKCSWFLWHLMNEVGSIISN